VQGDHRQGRSGVAKPARIWLLRKVETIGRDEVVAGLAGRLHDSDADVRETARRALRQQPVAQGRRGPSEMSWPGPTAPNWRVAIIMDSPPRPLRA